MSKLRQTIARRCMDAQATPATLFSFIDLVLSSVLRTRSQDNDNLANHQMNKLRLLGVFT